MRAALLLVLVSCGRINFDDRSGDSVPDDARVPYAGPNRVFVTSTAAATGNLGGFAGADSICQSHADQAGLEGVFVALLFGAPTAPPSSRLTASRGWVDMIGRPVADQPTQFDVAATWNPITYDETGTRQDDAYVYIGNQGLQCTGWTLSTGTVELTKTSQTIYGFTPISGNCAEPARIFCAEVSRMIAVAPASVSGRIAFLGTPWMPGGGLAGADAHCANDAAAAGLPGTYQAWLGSSAGGPEVRFTPGGEPWRRVDGTLFASSDTLLAGDNNSHFDSFLTRNADGTAWDTLWAWTGAGATSHCADWTGTGMGMLGNPGDTQLGGFRFFSPRACSGVAHLICLQL